MVSRVLFIFFVAWFEVTISNNVTRTSLYYLNKSCQYSHREILKHWGLGSMIYTLIETTKLSSRKVASTNVPTEVFEGSCFAKFPKHWLSHFLAVASEIN